MYVSSNYNFKFVFNWIDYRFETEGNIENDKDKLMVEIIWGVLRIWVCFVQRLELLDRKQDQVSWDLYGNILLNQDKDLLHCLSRWPIVYIVQWVDSILHEDLALTIGSANAPEL